MAYPHKRHRFQKFIVFLFAIVIILLVGYFVALPKIKTKAAGVVAEKLLESQITSDTSAIAGVNAQEILDAMNDTDRATVDQIITNHMSADTMKEASSYITSGDTAGLKQFAKDTLTASELEQIKELYNKYFPNGAGSIFTFEIKGDAETAKKFTESLELFSLLANVADVKSLVIHPASTTHSQLSEEELLEGGIKPNTIRLSIGTEHIDDIIADLEHGFQAVK